MIFDVLKARMRIRILFPAEPDTDPWKIFLDPHPWLKVFVYLESRLRTFFSSHIRNIFWATILYKYHKPFIIQPQGIQVDCI